MSLTPEQLHRLSQAAVALKQSMVRQMDEYHSKLQISMCRDVDKIFANFLPELESSTQDFTSGSPDDGQSRTDNSSNDGSSVTDSQGNLFPNSFGFRFHAIPPPIKASFSDILDYVTNSKSVFANVNNTAGDNFSSDPVPEEPIENDDHNSHQSEEQPASAALENPANLPVIPELEPPVTIKSEIESGCVAINNSSTTSMERALESETPVEKQNTAAVENRAKDQCEVGVNSNPSTTMKRSIESCGINAKEQSEAPTKKRASTMTENEPPNQSKVVVKTEIADECIALCDYSSSNSNQTNKSAEKTVTSAVPTKDENDSNLQVGNVGKHTESTNVAQPSQSAASKTTNTTNEKSKANEQTAPTKSAQLISSIQESVRQAKSKLVSATSKTMPNENCKAINNNADKSSIEQPKQTVQISKTAQVTGKKPKEIKQVPPTNSAQLKSSTKNSVCQAMGSKSTMSKANSEMKSDPKPVASSKTGFVNRENLMFYNTNIKIVGVTCYRNRNHGFFPSLESFQYHMSQHGCLHVPCPFGESICSKSFNSDLSCKQHLETLPLHTEYFKKHGWKCPICKTKMADITDFFDHMTFYHSEGCFGCAVGPCMFVADYRIDVVRHIQRMHPMAHSNNPFGHHQNSRSSYQPAPVPTRPMQSYYPEFTHSFPPSFGGPPSFGSFYPQTSSFNPFASTSCPSSQPPSGPFFQQFLNC